MTEPTVGLCWIWSEDDSDIMYARIVSVTHRGNVCEIMSDYYEDIEQTKFKFHARARTLGGCGVWSYAEEAKANRGQAARLLAQADRLEKGPAMVIEATIPEAPKLISASPE